MTKSVIKPRYAIGDSVFCTHQYIIYDTYEDSIQGIMAEEGIHDQTEDRVFPSIRMRVDSIRLRRIVDGEVVEVMSALESVYKVMRNRGNTMDITILTQDMSRVVRLEWPASKPFHDAFGPMEEKFTQIIYVSALNVDGNYKLIEVLDDQDW